MKSKRNRIVIDMDKANAGQGSRFARRRSGRLGRILLILAVALFVVLIGIGAGAYFWWQNYKAQPAYTLALLVDAAQRNDDQEIDRILDMDKSSEGFVGEVRARLTGSSIINSVAARAGDRSLRISRRN